MSLDERARRTNAINPNVFISIHHNALKGTWGDWTGTEVYSHNLGSDKDKELANIIAPILASKCGLFNRGAKLMQLGVLNCNPHIPAVLCEGGFMDSSKDKPVICSELGQRNYAQAVVEGLVKFLGLKQIEPIQEKIVYVEKEVIKYVPELLETIKYVDKIVEVEVIKEHSTSDCIKSLLTKLINLFKKRA